MNGYFKSLRRKFGIVTLVMACVFAVGWVRGLVGCDCLLIRPGGSQEYILASTDGAICLFDYPNEIPLNARLPLLKCRVSEPLVRISELAKEPGGWEFNWYCFGFGTATAPFGEVKFAPYWSIVIPLTLLSSWLSLSKTRAKKLSTESPPKTEP